MGKKTIQGKAVNLRYRFQKYAKQMVSLFDKMFKIVDANHPGAFADLSPRLFSTLENQTDSWLELCKEYYDTYPEAWKRNVVHAGALMYLYQLEKQKKKDPVDPQKSTTPREKSRNCIIDASAHQNQGEIAVEIKMNFTPLDHNGKSMCLVNLNELMTKLGESIEKEGLAFDTEEGIAADAFDAENYIRLPSSRNYGTI
jgi:hypothetical protein